MVKEVQLQEITIFDTNFAQYPLYHVTSAPAKFEIARLGDAFTRNLTDRQADVGTKLN